MVRPLPPGSPLLERAWRAYRNKGTVFVGVNIKDSPGDARPFLREFRVTYPQVRGEQSPSVVDDYGVTGVPETFFLDQRWFFIDTVTGVQTGQRNGLRVLGAIEPDALEATLNALVRKAHAPGRMKSSWLDSIRQSPLPGCCVAP